MNNTHHWIAAPRQADRDRLRAGLSLPPEQLAEVDAHRRLRGPYSAAGALLRLIGPDALATVPESAGRHYIELQESTPELAPLLPSLGRIVESDGSGAGIGEKNRFPARLHTLRIAHGLVDFLREYLEALGGGPRTLVVRNADRADATDGEFLAVLLRRLAPDQLTVVIETGLEPPADPPGIVTVSLPAALAAYAVRAVSPVSVAGHADVQPPDDAESLTRSAQAYIVGDCLGADPAAAAAYAALDAAARAALHDQRAAELTALGEPSLALGAIPYHLEHGTAPSTAGAEALRTAQHRCKRLGFYHAAADFGERGRRVTDQDEQPELWWAFTRDTVASLAAGGRPDESKALQDEARRSTCDPAVHMKLAYETGMLYARHYPEARRDADAARAWVNQAIAFASVLPDPKERIFFSVFNRNGLALVEVRAGRPAEALRLVDEGIARLDRELAPQEQVWHRLGLRYNRAQVNHMTGRLQEALADYAEVLGADEDFADHYFNRGAILRKLGRLEEAVADFTRSLQLEPPFPEAHYNRGEAYMQLGELDSALADFDRVLELEPGHREALMNRASLLADASRVEAALDDVRAGLAADPDSVELLCLHARLLHETGAADEAGQALASALRIAPRTAEAWALRGEIAYAAGDPAAAAADLERAVELADLPEFRFNRAVAYQAAGRLREAAADYGDVAARTGDEDAAARRDSCLRATERIGV